MYLIILGIPFWEMYKGTLASHEEDQRLQKRLVTLDRKLELVNKKISHVSDILSTHKKEGLSLSGKQLNLSKLEGSAS